GPALTPGGIVTTAARSVKHWICIGVANEIPVMRLTNIPGSFVRWNYVPLANARQISRRRRRR
ncbi:hypothetical protein ALC62_15549, partial [Cyphomyrmex costatus]